MEKQKYIAPKFTVDFFNKLVTQANGKVKIIKEDQASKEKTIKRLVKKMQQHANLIALTSSIKRNPEHFAYLNKEVKGFREKLINQIDLSREQMEWCHTQRILLRVGSVSMFDMWAVDDYIRYAEGVYK